MSDRQQTRSDRLLHVVAAHDSILIVMHDNPDPDAIATGWCVKWLIHEKLGISARLVAGGAIVRAENRHMLKLLRPPVELVDDLDITGDTAAILVDCGYGAGNHLLAKERIQPVAVLDHHPPTGPRRRLPFRDVRTHVAASATIAASYLREQHVEPESRLATALLLAIRTETRGGELHYSRLDRSILTWLTERANPAHVAEIENAPLPLTYFSDLNQALGAAELYGDTAFCMLPAAAGSELVGEMADLLIRCEAIQRVLCAAFIEDECFVSVRTKQHGENAAELLRTALRGLGHGGGHLHRAGGKIHHTDKGTTSAGQLRSRLHAQWVNACGIEMWRSSPLIPPHKSHKQSM